MNWLANSFAVSKDYPWGNPNKTGGNYEKNE